MAVTELSPYEIDEVGGGRRYYDKSTGGWMGGGLNAEGTINCIGAVFATIGTVAVCSTINTGVGAIACGVAAAGSLKQWGTCIGGYSATGPFYSGYSSISDTCW